MPPPPKSVQVTFVTRRDICVLLYISIAHYHKILQDEYVGMWLDLRRSKIQIQDVLAFRKGIFSRIRVVTIQYCDETGVDLWFIII